MTYVTDPSYRPCDMVAVRLGLTLPKGPLAPAVIGRGLFLLGLSRRPQLGAAKASGPPLEPVLACFRSCWPDLNEMTFGEVGLGVEPGPAMSQRPKPKEYRALAEECDRRAAAATDPETKIKFQQMARSLRELEIQAALSGRP